jgi:hypothetical protein
MGFNSVFKGLMECYSCRKGFCRHIIAEESTLLGHKAKQIFLPDLEYEGVNILRNIDN